LGPQHTKLASKETHTSAKRDHNICQTRPTPAGTGRTVGSAGVRLGGKQFAKRNLHICQKRPTHLSNATSKLARRDHDVCQKRLTLQPPAGAVGVGLQDQFAKRNPHICQKRPTHLSKAIGGEQSADREHNVCQKRPTPRIPIPAGTEHTQNVPKETYTFAKRTYNIC